jgi:hypothetical protein
MTFDQYLKEKYPNMQFVMVSFNFIVEAENWHAQELKSLRAKGANTTNSKYSKEQRSEWAKMGAIARMKNVDKSKIIKK